MKDVVSEVEFVIFSGKYWLKQKMINTNGLKTVLS